MNAVKETNNELERAVIGIKGMHCASCVSTVEKSLKKVKRASSIRSFLS
jgi:copper chaperone CopZ